MKKFIIIFLIIYSFLLFKCEDDTDKIEEAKKEKVENEDKTDDVKDKLKEEENNNEEENAKEEEELTGFYINDQIFEEKLNIILEEKHLKPKKKITKEQLRSIFTKIYEKKKKPEENKDEIDPETGLTTEQQDQQYMDSIFNEVTKSLDYDDKIRVREIKEWINPLRVQEAYAELLQGLAETMGYL